MKLPNADKAFVPPGKIKDYLLNIAHEEGGGKAQFFFHFGFSVAEWRELEKALLSHAQEHEVVKAETTPFGTRYVIEGSLKSLNGRMPQVRIVWFTASNEPEPRLVTAYPMKQE